jgi:hypothetical protein
MSCNESLKPPLSTHGNETVMSMPQIGIVPPRIQFGATTSTSTQRKHYSDGTRNVRRERHPCLPKKCRLNVDPHFYTYSKAGSLEKLAIDWSKGVA